MAGKGQPMPNHYSTHDSDYQPNNDPNVLRIIGSGHGPGTFVPFELIGITGDASTAILFSQILYWASKMAGREFYKSVTDWHQETRLSERIIRRIINGDKRSENGKPSIRDLGVEVEVKRANGAPTYHYRVNYRKLAAYLQEHCTPNTETDAPYTNGTNPHVPMVQNDYDQWYKSITVDYAEDKTTHTAPDKPSRADGKKPTHQQMIAQAVVDAIGISNPTRSEWSRAAKVGKELEEAGVAAEDFGALVQFVRNQAAGKWTVTMTSLTTNGRVSAYLAARNKSVTRDMSSGDDGIERVTMVTTEVHWETPDWLLEEHDDDNSG